MENKKMQSDQIKSNLPRLYAGMPRRSSAKAGHAKSR